MSQYAYQSTFAVSSRQQRMWRRNQNTVKFQVSSKLGPVAHTVLVVLMLAILGLIYLTQITKTSTYGYQINELEQKRDELLSKKKDLEVETARMQALERVQQSSVAKALDAPAGTEYAQN
jgi:cell division protein FtsL